MIIFKNTSKNPPPSYQTIIYNISKYHDCYFAQVYFLAVLPPVSVSVFRLEACSFPQAPSKEESRSTHATTTTKVYCLRCAEGVKFLGSRIELTNIPEGTILLENRIYKLFFHPESKLLQSITNKVGII